ncbi:MAG: xylan 1,4-beta-xylosidase, partial [Oscillospiraceae bacterium]|nr:xylan 1,4-beta-xylosidase [Oscillospiraceae bacterium]
KIAHYDYQKLCPLDYIPNELQVSREIIDSFPAYKGMEMHITEFNTSYSPRNPVHDTNLNAAYVAHLLSVMGDTCASYSYWTFGDVFEEQGIAFTPFSGCFGLLANGAVPKPTYLTYQFFSKLAPTAVARGDNYVVTKGEEGEWVGVAWRFVDFLGGLDEPDMFIELSIEADNGEYFVADKLVDEARCNPLQSWIHMGSPAYPSEEQLALLRECAQPEVTTRRISVRDEQLKLNILLSENAVYYFEIKKITPETDRGFDVERVPGAS